MRYKLPGIKKKVSYGDEKQNVVNNIIVYLIFIPWPDFMFFSF